MQIVGVVHDMREGPLDSEIPPFVYRPFSQEADASLSVVVRTAQSPFATLRDIGASIHQFDPDIIPVFGMTMEARINNTPSVYIHRLSAWLVGGFAALALVVGVGRPTASLPIRSDAVRARLSAWPSVRSFYASTVSS